MYNNTVINNLQSPSLFTRYNPEWGGWGWELQWFFWISLVMRRRWRGRRRTDSFDPDHFVSRGINKLCQFTQHTSKITDYCTLLCHARPAMQPRIASITNYMHIHVHCFPLFWARVHTSCGFHTCNPGPGIESGSPTSRGIWKSRTRTADADKIKIVVPSWAVAVASMSYPCASVSPPCRSCTLLLPHELQCKLTLLWRKARSTDAASSCTSSLLTQSPLFLPSSFSSIWSSAVNFFFLILCRLNWMEQNFVNADPELKKSRLQHVQEGQWQRQSLWFVLRLHFLCSNMTQPSARIDNVFWCIDDFGALASMLLIYPACKYAKLLL